LSWPAPAQAGSVSAVVRSVKGQTFPPSAHQRCWIRSRGPMTSSSRLGVAPKSLALPSVRALAAPLRVLPLRGGIRPSRCGGTGQQARPVLSLHSSHCWRCALASAGLGPAKPLLLLKLFSIAGDEQLPRPGAQRRWPASHCSVSSKPVAGTPCLCLRQETKRLARASTRVFHGVLPIAAPGQASGVRKAGFSKSWRAAPPGKSSA